MLSTMYVETLDTFEGLSAQTTTLGLVGSTFAKSRLATVLPFRTIAIRPLQT